MLNPSAKFVLYIVKGHDDYSVFEFDEKQDLLFWQLKLIAIILLAIITSYHIYSSKLALVINNVFAIIKVVMILSIIAIVGLVRLPLVLKESPNNWSFEDTEGFEAFSSAFVLVCNNSIF